MTTASMIRSHNVRWNAYNVLVNACATSHPKIFVRLAPTHCVKAHSCGGFLDQAQTALNHSIEIISGIEEARLIYLGAAHSLPDSGGQRLVVDIGGGSTELIIGEAFDPIELESLYVGCVGLSQRFFLPMANITKESMRSAMLAARLELQPVKRLFRKLGWETGNGFIGYHPRNP